VQNQIDVWTLPLGTERPFRILAVTADSIWLTEYDSTGNSVAQLVPSVNLLREYQVPTPGSNLAGLLSHLGQIWFTERAGDKVGVLNPAVSAPISTLLTRSTISTTAVLSTVTVLSRTLTASITPTLVITTAVARVATAGFTEYSLPPNTDWPFANRPFGLTATDDELWFAESGVNRLGVLAMPPHFDVYLPLTRR
jgi:streptogramin lyase